MMTLEELKAECVKVFNLVNLDFNKYDIKLNINNRLRKTLGRCFYSNYAGSLVPTKIEFSKQMLETSTSCTIEQVIKHECAHAIAAIKTNERHGHDKYFKEICAKINCDHNTPHGKVESTIDDNKLYKYFIKCSNCGIVAKYHKAGKVIKNLNSYKCKSCESNLKLIQNW